MKKRISIIVFAFVCSAYSDLLDSVRETCADGVKDRTNLCFNITIRDFNAWENYLGVFYSHSDFENFADTRLPSTDPYSHGCGNITHTNYEFLEAAKKSYNQDIVLWANELFNDPSVLNSPLKFGEGSGGQKGYILDLKRQGYTPILWEQAVTTTGEMVKAQLNKMDKPIKYSNACDNNFFEQWFNDVLGVNVTVEDFLVLPKFADNGFVKVYQISSNSFFP